MLSITALFVASGGTTIAEFAGIAAGGVIIVIIGLITICIVALGELSLSG